MRGKTTEFIVVARDTPGLFSRVAGVLTACGLNILGTHVYTTKSGLALEIYQTHTPEGGPDERGLVWREAEELLDLVIRGKTDVETVVRGRRRPIGQTRLPRRRDPRVQISNTESEFYTLVDVIADDRIGLLYDVTRTIGERGFEIYISKAATIKDQVSDAFYLKDPEGRKIKDPEVLAELRQSLLAAVGPGTEGDAS